MRSSFGALVLIALFYFQEIESSNNVKRPKSKKPRRPVDQYVDPSVYEELRTFSNNGIYREPDFMSSRGETSSRRTTHSTHQQNYQDDSYSQTAVEARPLMMVRTRPAQSSSSNEISEYLGVTPRNYQRSRPQRLHSESIMNLNSSPQYTQHSQNGYADLPRFTRQQTYIEPTLPMHPQHFQDLRQFNFQNAPAFNANQAVYNPFGEFLPTGEPNPYYDGSNPGGNGGG